MKRSAARDAKCEAKREAKRKAELLFSKKTEERYMAEGTRLRARGAAAASEPRARSGTRQDNVRLRVLHASAKLFLERGYTASTLRDIAKEAEVSYGSLAFALGS